MEVSHRTRKRELSGKGSSMFLLSNRKGGYALLGHPSCTHLSGVCFLLPDEWTMYRTIEDISLDIPPHSLTNKFFEAQRFSGASRESFFFFANTFYYAVDDYEGDVTIRLDMRRVYDDDEWDRRYKVYFEEGCVVVEYAHRGESFFLVIKGSEHYTVLNKWMPRRYEYDASRGGKAQRWVYEGLRFSCLGSRRLSFTFGRDKSQAIADAHVAFDEWDLARSRLRNFTRSVKTNDDVAYSSAVFALESLVMSLDDRTGVYAGLPWFFQFWARDELISLRGLMLAEKYVLVKDILFRYLDALQPDGCLPNRVPAAGLGSADAVGWLWKRVGDFVDHLQRRGLLWEYFSREELSRVVEVLEWSLRGLREHHLVDGLVHNGPQETWMDTHGGVGDVRDGARVEIQALTLSSLKTLLSLYRVLKRGNGREFRELQRSLLEAVRDRLVVGGMLLDGLGDATVRPNVFIAYYVYPELLSRKEWVRTFDHALEHLWLDWGGLSSIDRSHRWFSPSYDAVDDRSYHRGDSWFWVNNVAAMAMRSLDAERYRFHVCAIREASVRDLLWLGVAGQCSEVSSAREQSASGCFSQAWSAATLVELLDAQR